MNGDVHAETGQVLFSHRKGRGITFQCAVRTFKGRSFLDVREWAEQDGAPVATRKGATAPLD